MPRRTKAQLQVAAGVSSALSVPPIAPKRVCQPSYPTARWSMGDVASWLEYLQEEYNCLIEHQLVLNWVEGDAFWVSTMGAVLLVDGQPTYQRTFVPSVHLSKYATDLPDVFARQLFDLRRDLEGLLDDLLPPQRA